MKSHPIAPQELAADAVELLRALAISIEAGTVEPEELTCERLGPQFISYPPLSPEQNSWLWETTIRYWVKPT